jgi:hypothetical protein
VARIRLAEARVSAYVPPGWPAAVPPPGVAEWEQAASQWLLDLCPPDFRGYPVLRRHPLVLAWLAGRHVEASRQALARALGSARAELSGVVAPGVLDQILQTIEQEQARLLAAARAVLLLEQALRGHPFTPRL